jgi:two-component system OmpR family response regulator
MNVLLIEDDRRIAGLVERGLKEDGHAVTISHNGAEGAGRMLEGEYDLALLDILLPRHGWPFGSWEDAVPKILEAFDLGADDYLVKPFLFEILLARVNAIGRRSRSAVPPMLEAAGVTLDRNRRIAIRDRKQIALTRKQVELLEVLMRRCGLVTSREELIEAGWGNGSEIKENTLDVYIHSLRNKLEDRSENRPLIHTVHGTGYVFAPQ